MIAPGTLLGDTTVVLPGAPVIGQVDPEGRLIHLAKLEGWWEPPAAVRQVDPRAGEHGETVGPGFFGGRIVNLEARVDGWSPGDSLATAQRIAEAVNPDVPVELAVTDSADALTSMVLQEGKPMLARSGNRAIVSLSLRAPDPRRYGPLQTATLGLPTTSGGLSLPLSLPLSVNATQNTGSITIINPGKIDSAPIFTAYGPLSRFAITDDAGRRLAVSPGIPVGRRLVLDAGRKEARLDGTALRFVAGSWPTLRPGRNTFYFTADTYDAASRLDIAYRFARR